MVGGAGLFVWAGRPDWLAGWASYWYVPGVVAGVLAVVGLGLQGRTQLRIAAEMQKKKSDQEARERDKAGIAPARGRSDVDRHR